MINLLNVDLLLMFSDLGCRQAASHTSSTTGENENHRKSKTKWWKPNPYLIFDFYIWNKIISMWPNEEKPKSGLFPTFDLWYLFIKKDNLHETKWCKAQKWSFSHINIKLDNFQRPPSFSSSEEGVHKRNILSYWWAICLLGLCIHPYIFILDN